MNTRRIEVPLQGTGRGRRCYRGGAALAPAYGEFALSGRSISGHAPSRRIISDHAPTGHITVDQGKQSAALGRGKAAGMACVVPHAPTGHFTVAQGNALGTQTNQTCALKGHLTAPPGNPAEIARQFLK